MTTATLTLVAALALSGPVARPAGQLVSNGPPTATITHCLVSAMDDVQVPAQESGLLAEVLAVDGALIKKDDLIAQIDDRQSKLERYAAQMEREAALAKASDDIEVRFSEASLEVAQAELASNEKINATTPGLVPITEIRRLKLTKKRAELQIDKTKLDLSVAKMTAEVHEAAVKAAEQSILRRKIVAPMDGVVLARLKQTGEWVNAGEPVLRLMRMDRLRVEGLLNAADVNPSELYQQPVIVEVELAHGRRAQFQGQVTYISPLVTAGNKYRVRAEVVNRAENEQWLLRPGMSAVTTISLK
ncbi:MAG TPA: HlyD family efflux transporter periplasmic adaptor subunit [Pirellulaceae bacterium]|nr:HlyD family efflux transporter periplasmic adaptor subunit [Pirellulaceae bacterium]